MHPCRDLVRSLVHLVVWTVGHQMFGAVLGMVVLAAPRSRAAAIPAQPSVEQA
jgi:hypothetical protein